MRARPLVAATFTSIVLVAGLAAESDWPMFRGPNHDGVSRDTGLPTQWSPSGDNLAWRVPYGARSAPIVIGNRVCLQNTSGRNTNWEEADDVQERVMCLDADSGKVLWERRFSLSLTDVPPTRIGWASPAADPATGNLFSLGVAGRLVALGPDGKTIWERSLVEEFGAVTTHGGRAVSPVVEGGLVIVSELISAWGPWARGGNRYFAFDKHSGKAVWISSPQNRHYDTNYSTPIMADVAGMRLAIVGGTDGAVHALKALTGEPVWKYEMTKRAINTSVVMNGTDAMVTHSEENLDTNEMGLVAAIDATATGTIGPAQVRWRTLGWQGGFSSPVHDGTRLYQVDNGAVLGAFDLKTGARLWTHGLGTIQKAPILLGDGKLYVGTENGRFFILEPGATGVKVLDDDLLGTAELPEPVLASVGVGHGRIYVASMSALYAIGRGTRARTGAPAVASSIATAAAGSPAHVQVFPLEAVMRPGERVKFTARLFDAKGHFLREEAAAWSLEQLAGTVGADGAYAAPGDAAGQAGGVKATVGTLSGIAQVRISPPLPWSFDFESATAETPPAQWINATGKFVIREIDGTKALMRLEDQTLTRRARLFMGPSTLSDYTIEADVRGTERRRQLSDVGVFGQQYGLVLFGNAQRLELHPWQTAKAMTVAAPFAWKADTWYRMKLRVETLGDGTARVQGKVWAQADAEPAGWQVEKIDKIPHASGSPGLYADAPFGAYYDNIKVTPLRAATSR